MTQSAPDKRVFKEAGGEKNLECLREKLIKKMQMYQLNKYQLNE